MVRSTSSFAISSSEGTARLRVHGWLWTVVGGLLLIAALWEGPRHLIAEKLFVLGLGALDVTAGTLLLRRVAAGRWLLIPTLLAHLALAAWLWHDAQALAASVPATPSAPMTEQQMIERTAGGAMLGMIVLLEQGLAAVSGLLSLWTAVALVRSR